MIIEPRLPRQQEGAGDREPSPADSICGFAVDPKGVTEETISGVSAAAQRPNALVKSAPPSILAAVAEFECDLLIERTNAALDCARSEGKKLGRKAALSAADRPKVWAAIDVGTTVAQLACDYDTSRQTILRAIAAT